MIPGETQGISTMFVHGADTPGLRTTAGRPRAKAILVTLLMVAACIPLLACHKAGVYRIPVSDADILRANEISQEEAHSAGRNTTLP